MCQELLYKVEIPARNKDTKISTLTAFTFQRDETDNKEQVPSVSGDKSERNTAKQG